MTISRPLEETLNGDSAEQSEFKRDPIAYLAEKGLSLSEEARKQLETNVKARAAARPDWETFICAGAQDINSDTREQQKFQADPVAYLGAQGVTLSEEARKQLDNNVRAKRSAEPDWGTYIMASSKDAA